VSSNPKATPPGRTRLGNPVNGNAPRPPGACRVLMIGDLIGKPGRVCIEQVLPELREERGIDFVTAVARAAETADHHPDIDIRYTKIICTLSTHSAGGITQKDLDMARQIERVQEQ